MFQYVFEPKKELAYVFAGALCFISISILSGLIDYHNIGCKWSDGIRNGKCGLRKNQLIKIEIRGCKFFIDNGIELQNGII